MWLFKFVHWSWTLVVGSVQKLIFLALTLARHCCCGSFSLWNLVTLRQLVYCFHISLVETAGGWWRWSLVSPDGVAPSRMVGVSASLNLPLQHKVQKFSSGTGLPEWSRKRDRKTVVCVVETASVKASKFCAGNSLQERVRLTCTHGFDSRVLDEIGSSSCHQLRFKGDMQRFFTKLIQK